LANLNTQQNNIINKINTVTLITPNYPSPREIERGAFVERLVEGWEALDRTVNVIAPLPYFNRARTQLLFGKKAKQRIAGSKVLYPRFLSLTSKKILSCDLSKIGHQNFQRSVIRAQKRIELPDVFYGKFLMHGGIASAHLARLYGRRAFLDLGESALMSRMTHNEASMARQLIGAFDGIVCVSPRLREEAIALGAHKDRVLLAPNEADTAKFYPMDKQQCRRKLKLPESAFIVVFVGHFVDRKGPLRVLEAINKVGGDVKGLFLGRGIQKPIGSAVLHAAPVPNEELPYWLNAADVMMLPTLAEGSCNAINEAMACRLPIITSDIDDVRWQVNENCILVDPMNIDALASALHSCIRNQTPRVVSVSRIKNTNRATMILNWMETVLTRNG